MRQACVTRVTPPAKGKPIACRISAMSQPTPTDPALTALLRRIAESLERLAPATAEKPDFNSADAFVWHPVPPRLSPVPHVNRVDMVLLKGIDRARDTLQENTARFARGLPANN